MRTQIIAFGHRRMVGKDSAMRLMITHLRTTCPGLSIRKESFANKLKDICNQMYAWAGLGCSSFYEDNPSLKDKILPKLGMTPREVWIKFGTKAVREQVYERTWIDYFLNNVPVCDFCFIQDLRFPNEADSILEAGGHIYRIDCPNPFIPAGTIRDEEYEKIVQIADGPLLGYNKWTEVIENNGTLKEFNNKILELCDRRYLCQKT